LIGEIAGDTVTWRLTLAGTHDTVTFTGMFAGDEEAVILGTFSYAGKGEGSFVAVKR
jgi:hypothetical protein